MAVIAQKRTTPPDGWYYVQPETQTRLEHETLEELVQVVMRHRAWKGLLPVDHDAVQLDIERQICMAQFPGVCKAEEGEDYRPLRDLSRSLTLEKIEAFSHAAFSFIQSGLKWVDEETANRRADVCLGCKFNRAPHACACTPLWQFIGRLIPTNRRRGNLHICGICGCALQAKVLMPADVIHEADAGRDLQYPGYCWARGL